MTWVAYVSTYVPRRCGLATYTHHLRQSVQGVPDWNGRDNVVVMVDSPSEVALGQPMLWPLVRSDREAYVQMAKRINHSGVSVVSLQHEFGIFGGEAGSYILDFARHLKKPLVTTFHTVFKEPHEPHLSIQREIARRSDKVIVMNRTAIAHLRDGYGVPEKKIVFIPHGTPVPKPEQRSVVRQKLGWSHRRVLMTFGLLSRNKGIELVLQVLPDVVRQVPDVLYVVIGQTHPEVKKHEGEAYREHLKSIIRGSQLDDHVLFIDRYVEEDELVDYLMACDLYITPYPGMEQVTSGTLAYAVGLGRPVLSTPYSYAKDLLAGHEELLIPYGDVRAWTDRITALLSDPDERHAWQRRIANLGASMRWPQVGRVHAELFRELSRSARPGRDVMEVRQIATVSR
jgi:glycosyltransferase involved in cell wall biosynthesis